MQQRLRKKLEEREQENLKKQCYFMYEKPELREKLIDLRVFEGGERVCIRYPDKTLHLGTYLGENRVTREFYDEKEKKEKKITKTIHIVVSDGVEYPKGVDGDGYPPQQIGTYDPTKTGGRTRRNRRRKATRRHHS